MRMELSRLSMPSVSGADPWNQMVFPNPYLDYTQTAIPANPADLFQLIEYLYVVYNDFSRAIESIVKYFITDFDISHVDESEADQWKEFLNNIINAKKLLGEVGIDYFLYGISLSTILEPFRRFLICPRCGLSQPAEEVNYQFKGFKFYAVCPKCRYSGEFKRKDVPTRDAAGISVHRISPKELEIAFDLYSGKCEYYWRISPSYASMIRRGVHVVLNHVPWKIVEAVQQNALLKLHDSKCYCFKSHVPSGLTTDMAGWGIPPVMGCLKSFWYVQVLRRANEAVGMDYIVPIRMLFPTKGPEGGALGTLGGGNFAARLNQVITSHRRNPTDIHVLPFPVEYKAYGAEGKAVAPIDMLDKGMEAFLHSLGLPADLYTMNFRVQTTPVSLRWFEQIWYDLVSGLNGWLEWLCESTSRVLSWEPPKVKLQPVSLADDVELQQLKLRLAAAGATSWDLALRPFGISYEDQLRKRIQEQALQEKLMEEYAREQQERQQVQQTVDMMTGAVPPQGNGIMGGNAGVMAAAGGPPIPDVPPNISIRDLEAMAQQIATQLLPQMDPTVREQWLRELNKKNTTLHDMVMGIWEDVQRQAGNIGRQQILQGGGAMPM